MIETPQAEAPKANGLSTLLNVIAAPKEAFETLREAPTWGWALIVTAVLVIVGGFMQIPAYHHAFDAAWPQQVASSPSLSQMSPARLAQAKSYGDIFVGIVPFFLIIAIAIGMLIQTVVMMVFNAIGRGSGTFKTLWASAWNVAITIGIASVLLGVIVMLRGADSFDTQGAVQAAMPSLALVAPHAGKLTNFLAVFTPFSLWGAWLIVQAMLVLARTPKGIAWATGVASVLLPALFALLGPGAK